MGKKLLITGNGRCNITNSDIDIKYFHSHNMEFISNTLFDFDTINSILEGIGIILSISSDGKVYPMSMQGKSVVDILYYEAISLGVDIKLNQEILNVSKDLEEFIITTTTNKFKASSLIIATGSSAYPQLGASSIGLDIASSFGHNIITPYPSLVQLTTTKPIKILSGYRQRAIIKLLSNGSVVQECEGDVLFTNYGVSGVAILDISYRASIGMANYEYMELSINLLGNLNINHLKVDKSSNKPIKLWLSSFIHQKLAQTILSQNSLLEKVEKDITTKDIKKIIYSLKNFKVEIDGTRGEKGAEVMSGGVDTKELNYDMSSKIVKNLYFIGEVVDVVGDRGGYNLHWAWSSALRVAKF
ncbi:NAD(FAD)-utilizing dehydrogenases [hydrothermal vent metagenome]|uniref:NAD(FAD)-utilizing dehydrogenases n=1 Tax=hydrothermal vent metagenome TaxID=652676 RepID=A0A1W1ELF6_9ZZZZ